MAAGGESPQTDAVGVYFPFARSRTNRSHGPLSIQQWDRVMVAGP